MEQISGQIIEPCKDCNKIYCENVIDGKCLGDISKLDFCPVCKSDLC